jgi:hypothetical protein
MAAEREVNTYHIYEMVFLCISTLQSGNIAVTMLPDDLLMKSIILGRENGNRRPARHAVHADIEGASR